MAGRKRNSAEEIVRKLRRADELTAAGRTQEEIAGEMDADAAKELKELREQNSRLRGPRYASTHAITPYTGSGARGRT